MRCTVVGLDASRTGAPVVLVEVLGWAVRHGVVSPRLLLLGGGPLLAALRRLGPTEVLGLGWPRIEQLASELGRPGIGAAARRAAWGASLRRQSRGSQLLYVNSLPALARLPLPRGVPVVCHVHELDGVIATALASTHAPAGLMARPDLFVAASEAVRLGLTDRWGVPAARVRVHHECIDTAAVVRAGAQPAPSWLPEGAVVAAVGAATARKGADLFPRLAAAVLERRSEPTSFVWAGPDRDDPPVALLRAELQRAGLADSVHFVGETESAAALLARADVIVSPAREDPFPVALLEAGALGRPVVAFDGGGAIELLEGIGTVVPVLDVDAMAVAVADLLSHRDHAAGLGEALAERVRSRHDTAVTAPAFWADVVSAAGR